MFLFHVVFLYQMFVIRERLYAHPVYQNIVKLIYVCRMLNGFCELQFGGTGSGSSAVATFCVEGFRLCFLLSQYSLISWLFRQLVISNVHTDLNDTECQNKIVQSTCPQRWFVYLKGKVALVRDIRVYGEWRRSSTHSKSLHQMNVIGQIQVPVTLPR